MKKKARVDIEQKKPKRKKEMYISVSPFLQLPKEVQSEIFRTFTSPANLSTLAQVSKYFYFLAHNPFTWKLLVQKTWNIQTFSKVPRNMNWKLYYREKSSIGQVLNWTSINMEPHPPPRQSHGVAVVDNKMIIFGGHQVIGESFQRQDDIWAFDAITNQFKPISLKRGNIPAISRHRVVTIENKIYSFGGILQNKQKLNSIFTLDLNELVWEELQVFGEPPEPRCDPVVVAHNKKIIVFGGSVQDLIFPSDLYVFDTETYCWSQPNILGKLPTRIGCTGAVIGDVMYIYGGGDYDKEKKRYITLFTDIWALDLLTWELSWIPATGDIPKISDFLNVFVVGNHLIIGGGWYSEPYAFDTISCTWQKLTNNRPKINNSDTSAALIGNAVYYFGGYYNTYEHHLYKLDLSHLSFLLEEIRL